jgi:hypothetical protein
MPISTAALWWLQIMQDLRLKQEKALIYETVCQNPKEVGAGGWRLGLEKKMIAAIKMVKILLIPSFRFFCEAYHLQFTWLQTY